MRALRLSAALAAAILLPASLAAQEATIAMPAADASSYDPQLSAKEAVLANWALAASGIRAGHYVTGSLLDLAQSDMPFPEMHDQAVFVFDAILDRYNASYWVFSAPDGPDPIDAALLQAAHAALQTDCVSDCATERAAIIATFSAVGDALREASDTANAAVELRQDRVDRVIMIELLTAMADYLDGAHWHSDLTMIRDGAEVAGRVVGVLALWRNVEPYIGVQSPEVDDAINTATNGLLRELRNNLRGVTALSADAAELVAVRGAAANLATELRRAAALFVS